MNNVEGTHLKVLEALIFASAEPLPLNLLKDKMSDDADLDALLKELSSHYEGRGINLVKVGKGWAFRTNPDIAQNLMVDRTVSRKLSLLRRSQSVPITNQSLELRSKKSVALD